jgi:hypothetical protein
MRRDGGERGGTLGVELRFPCDEEHTWPVSSPIYRHLPVPAGDAFVSVFFLFLCFIVAEWLVAGSCN